MKQSLISNALVEIKLAHNKLCYTSPQIINLKMNDLTMSPSHTGPAECNGGNSTLIGCS